MFTISYTSLLSLNYERQFLKPISQIFGIDQNDAHSYDLFFNGDNLSRLYEHNADEGKNLIYLYSSINSSYSYNVLFEDEPTTMSDAQIAAFGGLFEVRGIFVS